MERPLYSYKWVSYTHEYTVEFIPAHVVVSRNSTGHSDTSTLFIHRLLPTSAGRNQHNFLLCWHHLAPCKIDQKPDNRLRDLLYSDWEGVCGSICGKMTKKFLFCILSSIAWMLIGDSVILNGFPPYEYKRKSPCYATGLIVWLNH